MKVPFVSLLAASGVLASSNHRDVFRRDASGGLVKRSASFAELMITDLQNLTKITYNITDSIKSFTDLAGALAVNASTATLLEALAKSQKDASNPAESLTQTEALELGAPTQFLAYAANASIAALISKKPLFESLGIGSLVVQSVQSQIYASNNFSAALLSKIPDSLAPVSAALNSQVVSSLNQGLHCFQGMNSSCNTAVANATRTEQAAMDSGAIPKSAAGRTAELSGLLSVAAVVVAGIWTLA